MEAAQKAARAAEAEEARAARGKDKSVLTEVRGEGRPRTACSEGSEVRSDAVAEAAEGGGGEVRMDGEEAESEERMELEQDLDEEAEGGESMEEEEAESNDDGDENISAFEAGSFSTSVGQPVADEERKRGADEPERLVPGLAARPDGAAESATKPPRVIHRHVGGGKPVSPGLMLAKLAQANVAAGAPSAAPPPYEMRRIHGGKPLTKGLLSSRRAAENSASSSDDEEESAAALAKPAASSARADGEKWPPPRVSSVERRGADEKAPPAAADADWADLNAQGRTLKHKGESLDKGFEQGLLFLKAAHKFMHAALLFEKEGKNPLKKVVIRYVECAAFWKRKAAPAFECCDELLLAAMCFKSSSACSMRAFRFQQKLLNHSGDVERELKDELKSLSARAKGAAAESGGGVLSFERLEKFLEQFQLASSSLEDANKAEAILRMLAKEKGSAQRLPSNLPSLNTGVLAFDDAHEQLLEMAALLATLEKR